MLTSWLTPNWEAIIAARPAWLVLLDLRIKGILTTPPLRRPHLFPMCVIPAGKGPSKIRPATTGDILKAIYLIPCVQHIIQKVFRAAKTKFNQSSNKAKIPAIMASVGLSAGLLWYVYNQDLDIQRKLLGPLTNKFISIPGAYGLSIMLQPRGGGLGYTAPRKPKMPGEFSIKASYRQGASEWKDSELRVIIQYKVRL